MLGLYIGVNYLFLSSIALNVDAKFNVKQKSFCDLFNVKHKKGVLIYAPFNSRVAVNQYLLKVNGELS